MQYELIVFDLAGTTVKDNKDVHRVLQSALSTHGVAITIEDANEVMGIPKPTAIRSLLEKRYTGEKDISDEWIGHIHRQFVNDMVAFYKHDHSVGEKAGVSETFRKLKAKGLKIFVDTGFDRPVTAPLLDRLAWVKRELIDGSVTSDEVPKGRPAPDMIYEAMRQAKVTDARKVIKVGDTSSDILQGVAAGCGLVIGITTGAYSSAQLSALNPHYLLESVEDIGPILE